MQHVLSWAIQLVNLPLSISSELMGLCITRWIQPQLQTQFLWNLMMRERVQEKELFLLSSPSAFSLFFWFRSSISQQLPTCWLSTSQSNTHCPLGVAPLSSHLYLARSVTYFFQFIRACHLEPAPKLILDRLNSF